MAESKEEKFYRSLYLIRRVEEEIARVYPTDKVKSPVHLSIGQEAISVGVCEALRVEDVVFITYRGHAAYLAKGGDLKKMIAELYGKSTGCAKGKGGSMHLVDTGAGVMGASAVVGSTIPHAAGYAYAFKLRKNDNLVVNFFGDGAVEEGAFHETMNFSALKNLPVLFVCENNSYSIHTRQHLRQPTSDISAWARGYNITTEKIEECDVFLIHEAVQRAVEHIRAGKGPYFLECMTYRWMEHVGPAEDFHFGYRDREEAEPWQRDDAIVKTGMLLPLEVKERIEAEVEKEIAEAFDFAEESPFPDEAELWTEVLAPELSPSSPDAVIGGAP